VGWNEGVEISEVPLKLTEKDGWLHKEIDPAGKMTKVVTGVEGNRFNEFWVETITSILPSKSVSRS
jgi:hypothetical protein